MDSSSMGGVTGGSSDEHVNQGSHQGKNSAYHRHTPDQIARLEEIFSECPHPSDAERNDIANELGLEPKQVKFWFQNKRTQRKTQFERANNNALRAENERIENENKIMKGLLRNVMCQACGGPPLRDAGENGNALQQLKLENIHLKEEHKRVSQIFAKFVEQRGSSSSNPQMAIELTHDIGSSNQNQDVSLEFGLGISSTENVVQTNATRRALMEKQIMFENAMTAKNEFLKLVCTDEPIWVKSPMDHRYVLHAESYARLFPRPNLIKDSRARDESSKDSRIVKMNAMKLIDMLLDSEKWANLFPTIVTKASTIRVVDRGSEENRSGALLLMHGEMHVLSPLVPTREFYFLRSSHKVEAGIWVIVDVSIDYKKENPRCCWRFPSGCMIHELSDDSSQVSWVEHAEVEDSIKTHSMYRDLVNGNIAYGAERWLIELERMSERITSATSQHMPIHDTRVEGRRNVLSLAHQIVKSFFGTLNMTTKMDFPQHLNEEDDSATRITIRKNSVTGSISGLQEGMIVIFAATSFWLPLPSQLLYDFFKDPTKRPMWDRLCARNAVHELAHISTNGTHPSNYVSIIRPGEATTSNVVIIQESFIDPLGAYVVYLSCTKSDLNKILMNGQDSSKVAILPSGIVISEDAGSIANARMFDSGNGGRKRGSLLNVAFHILMGNDSGMMGNASGMNLDSVSAVDSLVNSNVQNIKDAVMKYYHL